LHVSVGNDVGPTRIGGSTKKSIAAFNKANDDYSKGKSTAALEGYKAAIDHGAKGDLLSTCYYNYGVLLRGMGKIELALGAYEAATKSDPASKRARNNLCNLHRSLKLYSRAVECYKELSKLQPDDGMTQALIGDAMFFAHAEIKVQKGETPAEKAKMRRGVVKHLKAAVRLDPSLSDVYANIGKMYEDGGQIPLSCIDSTV